ncbi:MAG TPA: hypothetical protein PKZ69_00030 [Candidatus Cloacimonadota bacterium]|nr:hypothetical protein [Candidatus Cloacimonadota bacterium]HOQ79445.1 hypothetical protein [Candidatus Cloacimonadota bacterium]HPK39979.1 hypothetical protein [Candidatus Cloacimonadota bacterium]
MKQLIKRLSDNYKSLQIPRWVFISVVVSMITIFACEIIIMSLLYSLSNCPIHFLIGLNILKYISIIFIPIVMISGGVFVNKRESFKTDYRYNAHNSYNSPAIGQSMQNSKRNKAKRIKIKDIWEY